MKKSQIIFFGFLFFIISACFQNKEAANCKTLQLHENDSELIHLLDNKTILGTKYNASPSFFSIEGKTDTSIHIQKVLSVFSMNSCYIIIFESELMGVSSMKQGIIVYNKNTHQLAYSMLATNIMKARWCKIENENAIVLHLLYELDFSFMDETTEYKSYKIENNKISVYSKKHVNEIF